MAARLYLYSARRQQEGTGGKIPESAVDVCGERYLARRRLQVFVLGNAARILSNSRRAVSAMAGTAVSSLASAAQLSKSAAAGWGLFLGHDGMDHF